MSDKTDAKYELTNSGARYKKPPLNSSYETAEVKPIFFKNIDFLKNSNTSFIVPLPDPLEPTNIRNLGILSTSQN